MNRAAPFHRRIRRAVAVLAAAGILAGVGSLPGCISCPGAKAEPSAPRPERTGGAASIAVTPANDVNPVKTQHILVATVRDAGGNPVSGAKVEWILARGSQAVGDIVEVEGQKIDNTYAVGTTGGRERVLDCGTQDPADDVIVGAGQTWCVITSPVEGTTNIIAYAPEIRDWNRHKAFAEKTWMDVTWELPPEAWNRVGTPHAFNIRVVRFSDGSPYAGWQVSARLASGPAGTFAGNAATATATTDANGAASLTFTQAEPVVGTNEVEIIVVRPAKKDECECWPEKTFGPWIVRKHWIAPDIGIVKRGPERALLGEPFTYQIAVSNLAPDMDIRDVTVTDPLPEGLEYVSSSPSATVSGSTLTWNIGTMGPSATQELSVTVRATRTAGRDAPFRNCARVTAEAGRLTRESCVDTIVTAPAIRITKTATERVLVCDPFQYIILVKNTGDGPARDIRVVDELPQGVTTMSGQTRVEIGPFELEPDCGKEIVIDVKASAAGTYTNTATVTSGGASESASATTTVLECRLALTKVVKRADMKWGRPAEFTLTVRNDGNAEARDLVIEDRIPDGMSFASASDGGVANGQIVVWNLGTLEPGGSRSVSLTTVGMRTGQYTNTAVARAYCCAEVTASANVAFEGVVGTLLELIDVHDPIEVGGQETYVITVINQGNEDDEDLRVRCTLPAEQKFVSALTEGAGGVRWSVDGQVVTFEPLARLKGGEKAEWRVIVEAVAAGDVRFAVKFDSKNTKVGGSVDETESTHQY